MVLHGLVQGSSLNRMKLTTCCLVRQRSSAGGQNIDDHVAEDHGRHHDAESAANDAAAVAVELSAQSRSDQLGQHLKRVQRELDATEGLGQVRVRVRLALACSDRVGLGVPLRHNIDAKLELAVTNQLPVLLGHQVDPELARLILVLEGQP